jgi:hypothetical protein
MLLHAEYSTNYTARLWASALTLRMPCNQHGNILLPVQAKCAHWLDPTHRISHNSHHPQCTTDIGSVHQHHLCRSLCCRATLSHHRTLHPCFDACHYAPIGSASPYPPPHTILPLARYAMSVYPAPGICHLHYFLHRVTARCGAAVRLLTGCFDFSCGWLNIARLVWP